MIRFHSLCMLFVLCPAQVFAGGKDSESEKLRATVTRGLAYLVANQHKDGHWEGTDGKYPVAMTALAGMALAMNGQYDKNKYKAEIGKAREWLSHQHNERTGLIFSGHSSETNRYMYGHALATKFLATYATANYRLLLHPAVDYIVRAQSSQGGWYRTSKAEGHDLDEVLATVLQLQALDASSILEAERTATNKKACIQAVSMGQEYLNAAISKYISLAPSKYKALDRRMETAAGLVGVFSDLRCLRNDDRFVNRTHNKGDAFCKTQVDFCRGEMPVARPIEFGKDELCYYFYAQAVFMMDVGPNEDYSWSHYSSRIFDQAQKSQNKDGSWPASEGLGAGPIYSTAIWCYLLQLDMDRSLLGEYRSAYVHR